MSLSPESIHSEFESVEQREFFSAIEDGLGLIQAEQAEEGWKKFAEARRIAEEMGDDALKKECLAQVEDLETEFGKL